MGKWGVSDDRPVDRFRRVQIFRQPGYVACAQGALFVDRRQTAVQSYGLHLQTAAAGKIWARNSARVRGLQRSALGQARKAHPEHMSSAFPSIADIPIVRSLLLARRSQSDCRADSACMIRRETPLATYEASNRAGLIPVQEQSGAYSLLSLAGSGALGPIWAALLRSLAKR